MIIRLLQSTVFIMIIVGFILGYHYRKYQHDKHSIPKIKPKQMSYDEYRYQEALHKQQDKTKKKNKKSHLHIVK